MRRGLGALAIQAIICLIAVSFAVFALARLTGNPVDLMLDQYATEEDRETLVRSLGLDKPLMVQYAFFLKQAVQGDFGQSIKARRPALEVVFERLPATLQLTLVSSLWAMLIGLPVGVYAARWRGRRFDSIGKLFAILGQASPPFWVGLILIYVFAVWLGWLPSGGREGWHSIIMPAFVMGWFMAAALLRLTRSAMLDVLPQEYIKLARIKGLAEGVVIWKHAFKNATLPVLTFFAVVLVRQLGGSVITETVFAWPGVGRLMMDAVRWRDYPVVQTVVIMLAFLFIFANFCVDVLYVYLNPKIKTGGKAGQ